MLCKCELSLCVGAYGACVCILCLCVWVEYMYVCVCVCKFLSGYVYLAVYVSGYTCMCDSVYVLYLCVYVFWVSV